MVITPIGKLFHKTAKLNDVKFNKGVAKRFGFKYTGEIQDILKNGDSISLTIEKGRIVKSQRKGLENFTKLFFPSFDKHHDRVYKYDENGKLISRMQETLNGFDFLNSKGETRKSFFHSFWENTSNIFRYPDDKFAPTSIVTYKGSEVFQILSKTQNDGTKVLADFENGFIDIQQKGGYFAKMQDGILEFKNKNHEYCYDLKQKTLKVDDSNPSLITNHPHLGYNSTSGIETLKNLCREFIPEKLGEKFFKKVVEPMLK